MFTQKLFFFVKKRLVDSIIIIHHDWSKPDDFISVLADYWFVGKIILLNLVRNFMSYMPSYYIRVTRLTFINTEHTERYFNFRNSYKWVINLGTDLHEWFCRGNIGGFCHRGNRPQRCLLLSGTLMVTSKPLNQICMCWLSTKGFNAHNNSSKDNILEI